MRFEFLAGRVARELSANSDTLLDYLTRGDLPSEVAERVPVLSTSTQPDNIAAAIDILSAVATRAGSISAAAANAGRLVGALLQDRDDLPSGIELRRLYLRGITLRNVVLRNARIIGCTFDHVDMATAQLLDCETIDCVFLSCRFGEASSLRGTRVDVQHFPGMNIKGSEMYDPTDIGRALAGLGADVVGLSDDPSALDEDQLERIDVAEILLQHAMTHFYIGPDDDWTRTRLRSRPGWPHVEACLRRFELLKDVKLTKSGPAQYFWRFAVPPDIILGARLGADIAGRQALAEFWNALLHD
jgi:hypothetical protein